MKLLILHHYALPPSGGGGTRHFTLARQLVRRGHAVTIMASRHAYTGVGTVSEEAEELIDGVRFIWSDAGGRGKGLGGRVLGMIGFARDAYKLTIALARSGQDFDVVMGTSPQPFAAVTAARVARKLGKPYVLEIRDLWPMSLRDLLGWGSFHPIWLILRMIEKYLYRNADQIVTLLPGSQEWISRSGGRPDRITVVPNGVDVSAVPAPEPVRDVPQFTCVYAGAHGVANGLDTVVRAAALLSKLPGGERVRVRLIGGGPSKAGLHELAKSLNATALDFKDPVPKSQIAAELAAADAFILHLRRMHSFAYGVSPNKLFDYFLAGRPVIYAVEASNDPVSDARAGLSIRSEDPQALAEAMIALASTSAADRQAMGDRGYRYVCENNDWAVLCERVEEVLLSALKTH